MSKAQARWWTKTLQAVLCWVLLAVPLSGCSLPPRGVLDQGGGLPRLTKLRWGFTTLQGSLWSPNGQWIAAVADHHIEVLTPDGTTQHNLSTWPCGPTGLFGIAWLPDNRLSCFGGAYPNRRLCIGAAPFDACEAVSLPTWLATYDDGGQWTADGQFLMIAFSLAPGSSNTLAVVNRQGMMIQALEANGTDLSDPALVPHSALLSYVTGGNLVVSTLIQEHNEFRLGAPHTLATSQNRQVSHYAWSPTGAWVAVRYTNYQSGDKIYLVNREHPEHTVDVVLADKAGQQMRDPIWSPDGKTLIVFGVDDNQPYAIDIAAYLHSKGLEV